MTSVFTPALTRRGFHLPDRQATLSVARIFARVVI